MSIITFSFPGGRIPLGSLYYFRVSTAYPRVTLAATTAK
jgi:hypothetical protein